MLFKIFALILLIRLEMMNCVNCYGVTLIRDEKVNIKVHILITCVEAVENVCFAIKGILSLSK